MDSAYDAWEQALDLLEADLRRAEELADTGVGAQLTTWAPPSLQDPLPGELRERAQDLIRRQQHVQERLTRLIAHTGSQLDVARKVSGSLRHRGLSTARPSLYIDTTA